MSTLIKGIKLPTPPDELRLIIRPNGQVIICHRTEWDETEAVNVPPHGRLIDADALIDSLNVFSDRINGNGHFLNGIDTAKELAVAAPTIIEEEGEP